MTALRSFIFVISFYLWSAAISIAMTPLLIFPRRAVMVVMGWWGHGIIWLLKVICDIRVEFRGRQFAPRGAALVAPKHQCMFDVFAQFAFLHEACFVTKKELMWLPGFSWYAWKAGMIFVDRKGHSTALKKLIRDARDRLRLDRQLVIFPEGTRSAVGDPPDYKPGIAALYRELGLPVHPVATNSGVHWPKRGIMRKPGIIVFEYLEPIPAGLKRGEFMRLLEERIETASARLNSL